MTTHAEKELSRAEQWKNAQLIDLSRMNISKSHIAMNKQGMQEIKAESIIEEMFLLIKLFDSQMYVSVHHKTKNY